MALPINRRERKWINPKREMIDEMLREEAGDEDIDEHFKRVMSWKMTDNNDSPTNKPAWKIYEESVKTSYQKPNLTASRFSSYDPYFSVKEERDESPPPPSSLSHRGRASAVCKDADYFRRLGLELSAPSAADTGAGSDDVRSSRRHDVLRYGSFSANVRDARAERSWAAPAIDRAPCSDDDAGDDDREEALNTRVNKWRKRRTRKPVQVPPVAPPAYRYTEPFDSDDDAPTGGRRAAHGALPYYSKRSALDDPDYFDYDLQAAVNKYKSPVAVPHTITASGYEERVWKSAMSMPGKEIAPYAYPPSSSSAGAGALAPPPPTTSGLLAGALGTPGFWVQRFTQMGAVDVDKPIPPPTERYFERERRADLYESDSE